MLEPERDANTPSIRLPAGPHGYLLRLEPGELDAERFERQALAARQANHDGRPAQAVPLLTDALDLWRGEALADARDLSATRADVLRLEELYLVAVEELGAARLSLGEHALVVDVLSAVIHRHPLREKLVANLMLALYRSGRPADALRAYADLERGLDDQVGVRPSKELQKLEEDILLQRSSLDLAGASMSSAGPLHLHAPALRMIGRQSEVRELLSSMAEPSADRPKLVLISGPAGIGKTTLVSDLRTRLERQGRPVVTGHCEHLSTDHYGLIGQIAREIGETESWEQIIPTRSEGDGTEQPGSGLAQRDTARFRLFESIAEWINARCAGSVVILEDLHWADRPTLQLLRHLIRKPELAGLHFLSTYRSDDISGERLELIEALASRGNRHCLALSEFLDHEVSSFVRMIAPPESVRVLSEHASELRTITGGNPFFLRELLRELDDQPGTVSDEPTLALALAGIAPKGVCDLVERRIGRLTDRGRHLLHAAAALGEGVTTPLLAEACRLSSFQTLEAIEENLAARLLVEDDHALDAFAFPHALVCNAAYSRIPNHERLELHLRIAEILQRDRAIRPGAIAHHFCEATPLGCGREAARYAELAALESERHLMFAQAAQWYEEAISHSQALRWTSSDGRLFLALGRVLANDRQLERARDAFSRAAELAREANDSALLVEIALAVDGPWISGSELRNQSLALLEEALVFLPSDDRRLRVHALVRMASALYYIDPVREGQLVRQALEIAHSLRDPDAIASGQLALHRWYTHDPSTRSLRLALSQSASAAIKPSGDSGRTYLLLKRELLADLLENGDVSQFRLALSAYEEAAQRLASPADIYWAMALRATEATISGDLGTAEQLARGSALRGYELEQLSDGAYLLQRFVIRYQQGRLAEELRGLRSAARTESVFVAGLALMSIGLSEVGETSKAEELAWQVLGPSGDGLPRDVFWLAAIALFSGVAARGQDRHLQHLLYDLLGPFDEHVVLFGVGAAVLGSANQWLGSLSLALGHSERAAEHFRRAIAVAEQMEAPFWRAQAQLHLSHALSAQGESSDVPAVEDLAHAALATAEHFGFGRILREAADS